MMEKTKKNVPEFRFPGFSEDWVERILGDIARFSKGKGISKSDIIENGETECIRYGELYTYYAEVINNIKSRTNINSRNLVLSESNDVIIPASGETQIDIATASCVLKSGVALSGDLNIIKTENNGVFLSYYLNNTKKQDIANLAQGISVVHLYSSQLATLCLNLPTVPEQQKIASFLTVVDEKLQTLKKKKTQLEQYKNGMMYKIFSQELRFKDENGNDFPEWEAKTLGEVSIVKRGASPRPITSPVWFSENSNIGWVRISDVTKSNKYLYKTEQYLSEEGVKKSRLIRKGNLIMSICATIGKPIYVSFDVCIHDGFIVFDELKLDKEYLYYYLDMIKLKWYQYGQPGTQVNLNSEIVSNEVIPVPIKSEQTKIANFLSAIDEKIILCTTQIEKTELYKKGLLQKMFC